MFRASSRRPFVPAARWRGASSWFSPSVRRTAEPGGHREVLDQGGTRAILDCRLEGADAARAAVERGIRRRGHGE